MCLVLNSFADRAVWIWFLKYFDFCLCDWKKSDVYSKKVVTRDELLARVLDVVALINESEDQVGQTIRHLREQVAQCIDVDDGIFEY